MARPKKFKLDNSMTIDDAKVQTAIATAKDKIYSAKIKELKLSEAARNVIETKVVIDIVTGTFTKLKTILYAASNNLPAQIVGKEHSEVIDIVYRFIDEALVRAVVDFDNRLETMKIDDQQEEIDVEGEEVDG